MNVLLVSVGLFLFGVSLYVCVKISFVYVSLFCSCDYFLFVCLVFVERYSCLCGTFLFV